MRGTRSERATPLGACYKSAAGRGVWFGAAIDLPPDRAGLEVHDE